MKTFYSLFSTHFFISYYLYYYLQDTLYNTTTYVTASEVFSFPRCIFCEICQETFGESRLECE